MAPIRRGGLVLLALVLMIGIAVAAAQARRDHKAPRVSVTAPAAGASVSGTVTLAASASDDVGVTRVVWAVDGTPVASDTTSPWQAPWNSSTLANGTHSIVATASDAAGNVGRSSSVSFSIRNSSGSSGAPCSGAASPTGYQHVVWIVMENKVYSQIIGAQAAPYINALANRCGLATNFSAETNPSLPNYIAMTSGATQGITDDGGPGQHPLSVASIFSQLGSGGWRSLAQSMPSNCDHADAGSYSVHHNPAVYYTNISSQCTTNDVPLGATPDISARFTLVTPNTCNDMHDCSVATGDQWLSNFIPKILTSSAYTSGTTAVFLTWDEGSKSLGNHIATLVVAPSVVPGTKSGTPFSHYSMLRTTEELLGVTPYLGNAARASSMKNAFHL
jgi:phosphatidylinositol-3-phosphatase